MVDFKELKKIINTSKMSVRKDTKGSLTVTSVTDSFSFRGMPQSKLEEAQDLISQAERDDFYSYNTKRRIPVNSVADCRKRAQRCLDSFVDALAERKVSSRNVDSFFNERFNLGNSVDPTLSNVVTPNIYISPYEANALYSQKGIFETIINKKAKSILLNGLHIENPHLTQDDIDRVKETMEVLNFRQLLADIARDSMVYGGCLAFPMLKKDRPTTTQLPLSALAKLGVLGKDCIDYFVTLDRWNVFIVPPYNPTQKDFMRPDVYTIPFLGSDVHHSRCARVVTSRQAGYFGQIMSMGWGTSDFCGYLQSGMNYKVTIQSLPLMIQQMSVLARTVNVDGVLATEGSNALDALVENNTIRVREASPDNPITMDVLGDIKSINRDFMHVPELIRLLRQDLASDATIPEPMLFSSEKGNFASGDDTEGNLNKQWEAVKMIHRDIEPQIKQLMKVIIIHTLGTADRVMKALPYTQVHFDEPVIANALERSQIGKFYSETVFNLVSARLPIDISVEMASKLVPEDLAPSNKTLKELSEIQDKGDAQDDERFELEMEQMEADIENTLNPPMAMMGTQQKGGGKKKSSSSDDNDKMNSQSPAAKQKEKALADKQQKGYSKLEQAQHSFTRVGNTKRSEGLARARNARNK